MELKKRVLIIFFILLACIVCDRITKNIAKQNLPQYKVIHLLYDTVRLQYAENTGAFLSLGSNISEPVRYVVFTLLVGIFLACLLTYLLISKQLTRLQVMAMSLVLGGGCGNLIDRIANDGRVFAPQGNGDRMHTRVLVIEPPEHPDDFRAYSLVLFTGFNNALRIASLKVDPSVVMAARARAGTTSRPVHHVVSLVIFFVNEKTGVNESLIKIVAVAVHG